MRSAPMALKTQEEENSMKKTMKCTIFLWLFRRVALPTIMMAFVLMLLSILTPVPAAQAKMAAGLCPLDRPCLFSLIQQGHTITVKWAASSDDYDTFNIRWTGAGAPGQYEVDGTQMSSSLTNAYPYTTYSVIVQGCQTHFLASSTCSPWSSSMQITTVGSTADVCVQGFVWREAGPQDFVCVTPAVRSQAAYDNSQASARRNPYGAYGPYTCVQGYVWREAFANDLVCVTPAVRSQAAYDNSQAVYRVVH